MKEKIKECKHCGTTEDLYVQKIKNQYMDDPVLITTNICNKCRTSLVKNNQKYIKPKKIQEAKKCKYCGTTENLKIQNRPGKEYTMKVCESCFSSNRSRAGKTRVSEQARVNMRKAQLQYYKENPRPKKPESLLQCNHCGSSEDLYTSLVYNQFMNEPKLVKHRICNSCKAKLTKEQHTGRITSEETKEKLRQINLGKKHTEEAKRKMSGTRKGRIVTEETRKKLSKLNKGRKHTKESKENMSKGSMGIKHSEASKQKMSEQRMGKNNAFYGKAHSKKTREAMSIIKKDQLKNDENYVRLFHTQKSEAEIELFKLVKILYPDAVNDQTIKTKTSRKFPDIVIPLYNIIIEYDGTYFHDLKKDKERDAELNEVGYKVIHYQDYIPSLLEINGDIREIVLKKEGCRYKQDKENITHLISKVSSYEELNV